MIAPPPSAFTEAALREPLRHRLATRPPRRLTDAATTPCAVLIPIFEHLSGEAHIWLLRRPQSMRLHSGQVALPGGKCDPQDASLLATALRETREELGIDVAHGDVLGQLDDCLTITRFVMTPYVAWLPRHVVVAPNALEVARAFTAPLATFLDAPTGAFPFRGWNVDGEFVWGATGAVLAGLGEVVRDALPRT